MLRTGAGSAGHVVAHLADRHSPLWPEGAGEAKPLETSCATCNESIGDSLGALDGEFKGGLSPVVVEEECA